MSLVAKLLRAIERIGKQFRIIRARAYGVILGRNVIIGRGVEFRFSQPPSKSKNLRLGDRCLIDSGCILDTYSGSIEIGSDVFIGPLSVVYGHGGVVIGNNTLVASRCSILSSNHDVGQIGDIIRELGDIVAPTVIGSNCWLGTDVSVLAGVRIGDGAVVGAGSVVTRDVEPNTIVYGIPARAMGRRGDSSRRISQLPSAGHAHP